MHPYTDVLITRGAHIADWLLTQVDGEGSLIHATDMYSYTKCVYALVLAGRPDRAALVLNQILRRFGTADGDLMMDEQKGKKTCEPYTSFFSQTYSNSWVILGAEKLGRQETVRKLNQCLLDFFYDPEMGAMRSSRNPVKDRYDTCSAATGILCLLNSRLDIAEKLGDFLMKVEQGQPDRENIFYCNIEKPFHYATEFHPRFPAFTGVKTGVPGQAVWMIGYPIAALAKLYEYTGRHLIWTGRKSTPTPSCMRESTLTFPPDAAKRCGDFPSCTVLRTIHGMIRCAGAFLTIISHSRLPTDPSRYPALSRTRTLQGYSVIFDTTPEYCRWFFEVAAELNGGQ